MINIFLFLVVCRRRLSLIKNFLIFSKKQLTKFIKYVIIVTVKGGKVMENFLEILRNNQTLFIIVFFGVQLVYVILNTIKTILSVGKGKQLASVMSAICYAFYTIVLILTVSELNIWVKMLIIATTNYIGTFVSMIIVQKLRKDRLWEITATVRETNENHNILDFELCINKISFNSMETNRQNERVYKIYSSSQKESSKIKTILDKYNSKYIVYEETVRL